MEAACGLSHAQTESKPCEPSLTCPTCCLHAGIRQFHFNAWKDPNGTLASTPAGLKLAGVTNVTLDPKYTYFGENPCGSVGDDCA